jgi:hypothetical protein
LQCWASSSTSCKGRHGEARGLCRGAVTGLALSARGEQLWQG